MSGFLRYRKGFRRQKSEESWAKLSVSSVPWNKESFCRLSGCERTQRSEEDLFKLICGKHSKINILEASLAENPKDFELTGFLISNEPKQSREIKNLSDFNQTKSIEKGVYSKTKETDSCNLKDREDNYKKAFIVNNFKKVKNYDSRVKETKNSVLWLFKNKQMKRKEDFGEGQAKAGNSKKREDEKKFSNKYPLVGKRDEKTLNRLQMAFKATKLRKQLTGSSYAKQKGVQTLPLKVVSELYNVYNEDMMQKANGSSVSIGTFITALESYISKQRVNSESNFAENISRYLLLRRKRKGVPIRYPYSLCSDYKDLMDVIGLTEQQSVFNQLKKAFMEIGKRKQKDSGEMKTAQSKKILTLAGIKNMKESNSTMNPFFKAEVLESHLDEKKKSFGKNRNSENIINTYKNQNVECSNNEKCGNKKDCVICERNDKNDLSNKYVRKIKNERNEDLCRLKVDESEEAHEYTIDWIEKYLKFRKELLLEKQNSIKKMHE